MTNCPWPKAVRKPGLEESAASSPEEGSDGSFHKRITLWPVRRSRLMEGVEARLLHKLRRRRCDLLGVIAVHLGGNVIAKELPQCLEGLVSRLVRHRHTDGEAPVHVHDEHVKPVIAIGPESSCARTEAHALSGPFLSAERSPRRFFTLCAFRKCFAEFHANSAAL